MNRNVAYCYGISAASMACLIQSAGDTAFWDERAFLAGMLGATVPMCIIAAWTSENPLNKKHADFYGCFSIIAVFTGAISLSWYIFTVAQTAGIGFMVGSFLASILTFYLPETVIKESKIENPKEGDPEP